MYVYIYIYIHIYIYVILLYIINTTGGYDGVELLLPLLHLVERLLPRTAEIYIYIYIYREREIDR